MYAASVQIHLPVEGTARSFNPFLFYSHSFLVRLFVARTPTGDVSAIEDHSRGGSCAAWTRVRGETGAETILLCLVNSNDKKESNKRASCVTLKCDPKRVQLFVTDGARLSPMYRC